MKEADYIIVTNLAKLRIAEHVLRSVIPDNEIADSQHGDMLRLLGLWIKGLEEKVDRMVRA